MNKALSFSLMTLLGVVGFAGVASAQATTDPDIRNIRPAVMLLVDTSGSMERMSGGSDADLPMCAGSTAGTNERNRWIQTVEALTGTWSDTDYWCRSISRSTLTPGAPDYNYYLPYHQLPSTSLQNNDGILDVYLSRVKFGLMTFDATYTFSDSHPLLVSRTSFMGRLGENAGLRGGYSYGDPRPLTYPGCATTFMVDSGSRNEGASGGALIPIPVDETTSAAANQAIQSQLMGVRPFGGTPTAAMLHDLQYYLDNHPSVTTDDVYSECRPRFAILLTDGQPDEDFRDSRFDCDVSGGCPYGLSADYARDLCQYSTAGGNCTGDLDGLYVVAFDVSDSTALSELDAIAALGGTTSALRAGDRAELMRRLSDILDSAAPGNTTRSRPAFVSSGSTFTTGGVPNQYEFHAGFNVGTEDSPDWNGILERARYLCDGLTPEPEPVADRVQFHEELDQQRDDGERRLLTVRTPDPADMEGNVIGTPAVATPLGATLPPGAVTNQTITDFDDGIDAEYFGLLGAGAETRRDEILSWVRGDTRDHAMGDIYHSSPTVVGPPRIDIPDESYNEFRRLPGVSDRPTVVYVGTNDGVLHAFSAEDWTPPGGGESLDAGEELWGFIPPILLSKLESATTSHQIMLDGTPVVRDVFYRREPGDAVNGNIYHTVLIMGFRAGAPGYFALDVTDPRNPVFLWQYVGYQPSGGPVTDAPMGYAFGEPALGQVLVDVRGNLQERAVALLPGGAGEIDEAEAAANPSGCYPGGVGVPDISAGTTGVRGRHRCWTRTGRTMAWVDVVTGEVIREFDDAVFNAPLNGGVAIAPGTVGQIAQRGYVTDADGVMWSLDFSSRNPSDWSVRPLHDIFWDAGAHEGQPAFAPPIISTDTEGQFIVIQSTGNIDELDSSASNRVVSLTEEVTFSSSGVPSYSTELNWEVRLREGEQVTGPVELFESNVYFASFESGSDPTNACELGQSRLWGVHYLDSGSSVPTGYADVVGGGFPEPAFESTPGTGVFDAHFQGPFGNELILGVGITQRPTCLSGGEEFDPYIGNRYRVGDVAPGQFVLTAQLSGGPADPSAGAIRTIEQTLPTPQSFTTTSAFAGNVDY